MFSIIVPVYNREKTISTCIGGILNTIYKDFEIILIDDGSNDNSFSICEQFAAKYSNIKCIKQNNSGVSSARNRGLKEANGKYLLFVDSDDTFYPNTLFELQRLIESQLDFIVFKHGYGTYDKSRIKFQDFKEEDTIIRIEGNLNIIQWLYTDYKPYSSPIYSVCGKVFLKEIITNHNLKFRENISLGEDQIFVCDYLKYVKSFLCINKPYYQRITWPKIKRPYGLGSVLRSPDDFLLNQKENYLALNSLYSHCRLMCVKEFTVNYILDRPITRIVFRHSILANKNRVPSVELIDFIKNNIKPILALEYSNVEMLHNKKVLKYVKLIMDGAFRKAIVYSFIEQNFSYYVIKPIWRVLSFIKHLVL